MKSVTAFLAAALIATPAIVLAADTTTGKVNKVDAAKHVVNLTHGPIASLGWPGMTMDFGVAPTVDLSTLKVGDTVSFSVGKANGVYVIDSLTKN